MKTLKSVAEIKAFDPSIMDVFFNDFDKSVKDGDYTADEIAQDDFLERTIDGVINVCETEEDVRTMFVKLYEDYNMPKSDEDDDAIIVDKLFAEYDEIVNWAEDPFNVEIPAENDLLYLDYIDGDGDYYTFIVNQDGTGNALVYMVRKDMSNNVIHMLYDLHKVHYMHLNDLEATH